MSVIVHYAGNPDRAKETVAAIERAGGTATALQADIADEAEVAALFDQTEAAYDGIDVLVNTAGIMLLSPLAELDLADFDRMHRTNVRGTFIVSQQAARRVRSGGAIINFSTTITKLALPTYSAYAATKGAVDALTLILAKELRGRDITVNAVAPGPTATPLFLQGKDQATVDHMASMAPLERLGQPEDIAETVAFLADPARWVNGQVLYANGQILKQAGRLDVVVHNAGHMVLGPTEAFTPEQLAAVYDTNVLSTQRVNRAALPHLRAQRDGLVVLVGSTSTRGGTPPYLGPYFAAKAAEDSLAVSYAAELARFGIETTIIVPGSFTAGTKHFANAGHPDDTATATAFESEYAGLMDQIGAKLAELAPADADPTQIAREIVAVVGTPKGSRPCRVHVDPAEDGAERVNALGDQVREQFYARIELTDLLHPSS